MMHFVILLVVAAVSAFVLTGLLRVYAARRNLVDLPGARSSHAVATYRGGGLAFALAFLGGLAVMATNISELETLAIALAGAGLLVAAVGFVDDHADVAPKRRLFVHGVAAAWALTVIGGLPPVTIAGTAVALGPIGHLLAALYLVWLVNLYNFMDGIDGLASVEAVTVGVGGALVWWIAAPGSYAWAAALLLAAAVAGFIPWNFPTAKIFMGDTGSGFLGIMLGTMSIAAAHAEPALLWAWLILLGAFIADATVTLARRALRRERLSLAHREHAYQRAAMRYGTHAGVTLAVAGINLFWLLPFALLVTMGYVDGFVACLAAYLPLVWFAVRHGAGAGEPK